MIIMKPSFNQQKKKLKKIRGNQIELGELIVGCHLYTKHVLFWVQKKVKQGISEYVYNYENRGKENKGSVNSMGVRVGLIFLFILGTSWVCDARELVNTNLLTRETETSDASVLQITHQESEREIQASDEVGKKINVCTLCEEYAGKALDYLSENKTQTEIMQFLYKSCSKLLSFKQECLTLVDYYAPLFFLEVSSIQPGDFCREANLCENIVFISKPLSKDSCGFCHRTIEEALSKLKDPDTELEIFELLLKGCDAVESYAKKCKRMVFEYGPLILSNAEQFLEATDICTLFHFCRSPTASVKQAFMGKASLLAKY